MRPNPKPIERPDKDFWSSQTVSPALEPIPVLQPEMPPSEQILPYLRQIETSGWFSNFGPLVRGLEERLAQRFGADSGVVTVANGTVGLTLALMALDLPEGTLCACPSWTFVATAHAIRQAGLTPFFLDVAAETAALDPISTLEQLASAPARVGALIVVSPFGQPLDVEGWLAFRERTGLPVIVDAAAQFDSAADARLPHVVSLHATKILGVGEGGFIASDDKDLCHRLRSMTTFGFRGSRDVLCLATNAKLSEYAAAVGHAALDLWPRTRLKYRTAALKMRALLFNRPELSFQKGWGDAWVTSVCAVQTPLGALDALEAELRRHGCETRRWWGRGCHREIPFQKFPRAAMPVTERLAQCTLGAPFFAGISDDRLTRIAAALDEGLEALEA